MRWVAFLAFVVLVAGCGETASRAIESTAPVKTVPAKAASSCRPEDPCRSPDGVWLARLSGKYAQTIVFTNLRTGREVDYSPTDYECCLGAAWVKPLPHLIVFEDPSGIILSLRAPAFQPSVLDYASEFNISPDGRWMAAWLPGPKGFILEGIRVISTDGTSCRSLPANPRYWDSGATFTSNSKGVIVSVWTPTEIRRVRYTISSLPAYKPDISGC